MSKQTISIPPGGNEQIVYLTDDSKSWVELSGLPDDLLQYATDEYKKLFELHPADRGNVVMQHRDQPHNVPTYRWYQSYLWKPRYDKNTMASYMYSGLDESVDAGDLTLPSQFQPFLDFMNKDESDSLCNQMILNWYLNGNDKLAAHSDCTKKMVKDAPIAIMSLNEGESREFRLIAKLSTENAIAKNISIIAPHGCIIKLCGETNAKFRHCVPKNSDITTSRISLTFRKMIVE